MGERMSEGCQALTEKEKQTLRLVVRGYDAKSLASHLDISVHTVNERLRQARRKMAVSSSREAARLLLEHEGEAPSILADKELGDAGGAAGVGHEGPSQDGHWTRPRFVQIVGGLTVMSLLLITLALGMSQTAATGSGEEAANAAQTAPQTELSREAHDFLALVDAQRWDDAYERTDSEFRRLNSVEQWSSVSQEVRDLLGPVLSRDLIGQAWVPAPLAGYEIVRFRASYQNRPEAIETVTFVREDGSWKVAGIWIS